ncbi:hypothetical protein TNCV_2538521 [Trichonephila clavipes]|nr:hypothetical protein TNCV_2538521 [Trichonephila clavipes]
MADCELDGATRYCPLASPSRWLRKETDGNDTNGRGSERKDIRTREKTLRTQEEDFTSYHEYKQGSALGCSEVMCPLRKLEVVGPIAAGVDRLSGCKNQDFGFAPVRVQKHLSSHLPVDELSSGSKGVGRCSRRCTCGDRVHKESRLDVDVFEK